MLHGLEQRERKYGAQPYQVNQGQSGCGAEYECGVAAV